MWAGCPRTGLCIKPLFTSYAATPVPPSACPQETATGPSSLLEATTLVLSLEFQFHFTRRLEISTLAYMSGFFPNFPRFLCHPPPPPLSEETLVCSFAPSSLPVANHQVPLAPSHQNLSAVPLPLCTPSSTRHRPHCSWVTEELMGSPASVTLGRAHVRQALVQRQKLYIIYSLKNFTKYRRQEIHEENKLRASSKQ